GVAPRAGPWRQPRQGRRGPGRVDARAEGREDAHSPVSDLVAIALDDDRAVARDDVGRLLLLLQIRHEVRGRLLVEAVLLAEPARGRLRRLRGEAPRDVFGT